MGGKFAFKRSFVIPVKVNTHVPPEKTTLGDRKKLALWAAACAEHVAVAFASLMTDDRPRHAIDGARAWVEGKISVAEARRLAFAAHAAARSTPDPKAKAAARSAAHAAATAHVAGHATHAAHYAIKAAPDPHREKAWQSYMLEEMIR
ncbi:MAG TPA: hypothetical protein VK907_03480 [Phnomibacter sp.]|nr:hypothetical protein [Phnomibacter sp.]